MKFLVIGDFHGKFLSKLKKEIKNVDLIVSVGDYASFFLREEFFKYSYKSDVALWEVIGKQKVKQGTLKDVASMERVLRQLNGLGKPVITVTGNLDYAMWSDAYDGPRSSWKWPDQDFFSKVVKKFKKIQVADYFYVKFEEYVFIGMARSTFPGNVKSKAYKRFRKKLDRLFKRFKKEKVIFVSHNMPYGKLDKIDSDEIPEKLKRKHYGSKLARRIIEKYKPFLFIGGHMHENQGKAKIGKTLVLNAGAAVDGRAAVIEIKGEKVGKVRFIK